MNRDELKNYVEYMETAIEASMVEFMKADQRVSRFNEAYNIDTTRPKIDEWVGDKSFTESFISIHTAFENYRDVLEEGIINLLKILKQLLTQALEIYPEDKANIYKKLKQVDKDLNARFKPIEN